METVKTNDNQTGPYRHRHARLAPTPSHKPGHIPFYGMEDPGLWERSQGRASHEMGDVFPFLGFCDPIKWVISSHKRGSIAHKNKANQILGLHAIAPLYVGLYFQRKQQTARAIHRAQFAVPTTREFVTPLRFSCSNPLRPTFVGIRFFSPRWRPAANTVPSCVTMHLRSCATDPMTNTAELRSACGAAHHRHHNAETRLARQRRLEPTPV